LIEGACRCMAAHVRERGAFAAFLNDMVKQSPERCHRNDCPRCGGICTVGQAADEWATPIASSAAFWMGGLGPRFPPRQDWPAAHHAYQPRQEAFCVRSNSRSPEILREPVLRS